MRHTPHDVLLVDYHKLMRDGIRAILEHSEFRVVGEAESGADAVQLCEKMHPDLVSMEIDLPDMNGIKATAESLRQSPQTRILIVSVYDDENAVLTAIRSGARGFLPKRTSSSGDLIGALRAVAHGGSYLSSDVSTRLLDRIQSGDLQLRSGQVPLETISPRERQVLRLIVDGKTSKEIAVLLVLSEQTVRSYRKALMKKLGVNNVAGLAHMALSAGLTH